MSARVPEKVIAERVKRLFRLAGCEVVSFQQPRRTMQTPGIPDLKIYYVDEQPEDRPQEEQPKSQTWWFEVKAEDGKQSDWQARFQAMAEACGERYVMGGVEEANQVLIELGLKEPGWVYF